jgi:hypothetical protein
VFERCGKVLVVMALVLTTGLHWAALQTVAWTTMLASNLCDDSFSQAVSKTFDGLHPCCLCKAIAGAKKAGKKSEAVSPVMKMEFLPVAGPLALIPPRQFEPLPLTGVFAESLALTPPVPPPRTLPV